MTHFNDFCGDSTLANVDALRAVKHQVDDDARKLLQDINTERLSDRANPSDHGIAWNRPDLGGRAIEILRKLYPDGWV